MHIVITTVFDPNIIYLVLPLIKKYFTWLRRLWANSRFCSFCLLMAFTSVNLASIAASCKH